MNFKQVLPNPWNMSVVFLKPIVACLSVCIVLSAKAAALQLPTADAHQEFAETTLSEWQEKSFVGHTHYKIVQDNGKRALLGTTNGQASVLYRPSPTSLRQTPWLNWSWKVSNTFGKIEEQSRAGDDFPARIYVVARIGFLPWETLAINYVWSSSSAKGSSWPSPYTDKSRMIAVQSGNAQTGDWVRQKRNVAEDFKQLFGRQIDLIDGYAVMVDGDNTGRTATAYFGNIEFSAN